MVTLVMLKCIILNSDRKGMINYKEDYIDTPLLNPARLCAKAQDKKNLLDIDKIGFIKTQLCISSETLSQTNLEQYLKEIIMAKELDFTISDNPEWNGTYILCLYQ